MDEIMVFLTYNVFECKFKFILYNANWTALHIHSFQRWISRGGQYDDLRVQSIQIKIT